MEIGISQCLFGTVSLFGLRIISSDSIWAMLMTTVDQNQQPTWSVVERWTVVAWYCRRRLSRWSVNREGRNPPRVAAVLVVSCCGQRAGLVDWLIFIVQTGLHPNTTPHHPHWMVSWTPTNVFWNFFMKKIGICEITRWGFNEKRILLGGMLFDTSLTRRGVTCQDKWKL